MEDNWTADSTLTADLVNRLLDAATGLRERLVSAPADVLIEVCASRLIEGASWIVRAHRAATDNNRGL